MKVILDENVPQKLRLLIGEEHSVVTTWYQGWSSFKNGAVDFKHQQLGSDQTARCKHPRCNSGGDSGKLY